GHPVPRRRLRGLAHVQWTPGRVSPLEVVCQRAEKASLAYFASSQLEASKGVLWVVAGIAVEKYEQALAIIREQVAAMADGRFTDQELENTRKGLINGVLSAQDSPGRIIGGRLVGIVNGRVRPVQETIAALEGVTREDVVRVAERIRPDTVYFLRTPQAPPGKEGH